MSNTDNTRQQLINVAHGATMPHVQEQHGTYYVHFGCCSGRGLAFSMPCPTRQDADTLLQQWEEVLNE